MDKGRYIRKFGKTRYLIKKAKEQRNVPKGIGTGVARTRLYKMLKKVKEEEEKSVQDSKETVIV